MTDIQSIKKRYPEIKSIRFKKYQKLGTCVLIRLKNGKSLFIAPSTILAGMRTGETTREVIPGILTVIDVIEFMEKYWLRRL